MIRRREERVQFDHWRGDTEAASIRAGRRLQMTIEHRQAAGLPPL